MKKKLICMLVLSLSIFSYYTSRIPTAAEDLTQTSAKLVSTSIQRKVRIIRSVTTLKRGEIGIITIQGEPGMVYTIETSFAVGSRTIPVNQVRTGDSKGLATFNWVVGEDTVPGTYPVKIYGDGEILNLSHTVLQ
jgi:hypothetical protein